MQKTPKTFLPWIVLTLLAAYHAINAEHSYHYRCPFTWKSDALEIRHGNKTTPLVKTPVTHQGLAPLFPDISSFTMARPGFILRYLVGEGREDVYVAKREPARRFYLREELKAQYVWPQDEFETFYAKQLRELIASAKQQNLNFLILPVPPKMSVERNLFGTILPAGNAWEKHPPERPENFLANYRRILDLDSEIMVDIFEAFRDYREKNPQADIYMPADSHWASLGVGLAAQAVLKHLQKRLASSLTIPDLKVTAKDPQPTEGDLARLLSLPRLFTSRHPDFNWRETYYDFELPTPPENSPRVVLIGTSYSHYLSKTPHGLASLIGKALGRSSLTVASAKGGRLIGSLGHLRESNFRFRPDDLVIFEFATRQSWQASERLVPIPPVEPATELNRSISSETF